MADLTLTATGIRTTADVTRFLEAVAALGITGVRAFPLLDSPDGLSVAVSVDLNSIRLSLDERS